VSLTSVEICTGGGGQAIGLEQAGFEHLGVAEIDKDACATLRLNRPGWKVIEGDIRDLDGHQFDGVDLFAGGVPCPPFSVASKQLGAEDPRNMFPAALDLIRDARPRAVLLENVKGLSEKKFNGYRTWLAMSLTSMGYMVSMRLLQAADYGVPQLRPRFIIVAFRDPFSAGQFVWPGSVPQPPQSVGQVLYRYMAARGWPGAWRWAKQADRIAPTIVGGSKKHGGPDLGPTRARAQWMAMRVNGISLASMAPGPDEPMDHIPRLTLPMVARLQCFPEHWAFMGNKTARYRQIGNALPPPVARALGDAIAEALR
jgi:DNA (cytosine-5)-methyltransferase 1